MSDDLERTITGLYRNQLEAAPDDYLAAHSANRAVIRRQVEAFEKYLPFVRRKKILDWGCRQAVDACLLRRHFGNRVELHGCDVVDGRYEVFHDYAKLVYKQLDSPHHLPYEDGEFNTVIGSGVLEHVPNDSESLKEIYRILRLGGHFIVTFLPNRTSWAEALNRALGRSHHRRRYSKGGIRRMLLHHGFRPVHLSYHQVLPTLAGRANSDPPGSVVASLIEGLYRLNDLAERLWLIRGLAANIMIVGEKRRTM
ncbi:MAG: methyltransferase domain-containing protein [Phycisphaerales bacterium]|nr:MAG: methyltransferase domain-containing protein [Phycisphaerales bacterium]